MNWIIPGTVIEASQQNADQIDQQLSALFLAGGVSLGQISSLTGLETYTVQNWVKRGFLTNPVNKRYSLRQLCRILNINMLKAALPMEEICGLLSYVNGDLSDESDDLIDDSKLYFLFVRLASNYRQMNDAKGREAFLDAQLEDYEEPVPGAKGRVKDVLRVMLTAWAAAQLRLQAEQMLARLKDK